MNSSSLLLTPVFVVFVVFVNVLIVFQNDVLACRPSGVVAPLVLLLLWLFMKFLLFFRLFYNGVACHSSGVVAPLVLLTSLLLESCSAKLHSC